MPKWLSAALIIIGFLALIGLAFLPRTIEVNVTTTVDDRAYSYVGGDNTLHQPPASDEGASEED